MAAVGTGDPWHWVTQWDGQTKLLNRKPKTSAVRETRVKAVTHAWVTPAKQWLCVRRHLEASVRVTAAGDLLKSSSTKHFHFIFVSGKSFVCTCEVFCRGRHSTLLEESICVWIYDQEWSVVTPGFNNSHHLSMLLLLHRNPVDLWTNNDTPEDTQRHSETHAGLNDSHLKTYSQPTFIQTPSSTFLTLSQFIRYSVENGNKIWQELWVKLCQNKFILIMSDNFDRKVCND